MQNLNSKLYLDYAASAPLRDVARDAWLDYHSKPCSVANPNSLHSLGREASSLLEGARKSLSRSLGSFRPSEIVFTSGGTESNNMALLGIAEGVRNANHSRSKVILSAIEHDSILDVASLLHSRGFEVAYAKSDAWGVIAPQALNDVLDNSCALVSVMAANNETGVIQPIAELAKLAHASGAKFHVDAIQAFGHIPLELTDVDSVSIASHKIGGPVGVGAMALRSRCPFIAPFLGGGQESGKRPGTQDVAGAVAFAAAAEHVCSNIPATRDMISKLSQRVYEKLCAHPQIIPTVPLKSSVERLPNIVSIMVLTLDSETLVLKLDEAGYEVSAGSACSSGSLDPSHVLSAMGIARDKALGSLRISFDERVSEDELDAFCEALLTIVEG